VSSTSIVHQRRDPSPRRGQMGCRGDKGRRGQGAQMVRRNGLWVDIDRAWPHQSVLPQSRCTSPHRYAHDFAAQLSLSPRVAAKRACGLKGDFRKTPPWMSESELRQTITAARRALWPWRHGPGVPRELTTCRVPSVLTERREARRAPRFPHGTEEASLRRRRPEPE
jgi:hypothetical protein